MLVDCFITFMWIRENDWSCFVKLIWFTFQCFEMRLWTRVLKPFLAVSQFQSESRRLPENSCGNRVVDSD